MVTGLLDCTTYVKDTVSPGLFQGPRIYTQNLAVTTIDGTTVRLKLLYLTGVLNSDLGTIQRGDHLIDYFIKSADEPSSIASTVLLFVWSKKPRSNILHRTRFLMSGKYKKILLYLFQY